jgi:L-amino acid N-acyltransferase YncA
VTIDELRPEDWSSVTRIFEDCLDVGTFEESVPSWDWDASHLVAPRLVARDGGDVVGWAALAPISRRACYRGVVENSTRPAASASSGSGSGSRRNTASGATPPCSSAAQSWSRSSELVA